MGAPRTGLYREVPPPPDLAPFVACTWTRVVAPGAGIREPVIPDACTDIIIVAGEAPHVAGPADRTEWVALPGGTVLAGVRFRPGAARDLLRTDLSELRNRHVELADVVGGSAHALARDLDREQPERALLAWVRARLTRRAASFDLARLALHARSVDDITSALGWNARRLHRHVTDTCGYGPKLLQRILRLQHAIRIAHDGAPTLAAVAAAAGYADQAHMTRELVAFTGLSPRAYLELADPRVGTWFVSDLFKTARASGCMLRAWT